MKRGDFDDGAARASFGGRYPPSCPTGADVEIRRWLDRDDQLSELRQLLALQFWLWGQDVRSPGGNRLVQLGMSRHPAPGSPGHSRYEDGHGMQRIVLWGWGMALVDEGLFALLLPRSFRVPVLIIPAHVRCAWKAQDLPFPVGKPAVEADLSVLLRSMGAALEWIAGYERRVAAMTPPVAIAPGHDFPPVTTRSELAALWQAQANAWTLPGQGGWAPDLRMPHRSWNQVSSHQNANHNGAPESEVDVAKDAAEPARHSSSDASRYFTRRGDSTALLMPES